MSEKTDHRDKPETQLDKNGTQSFFNELSIVREHNSDGLTYWFDKQTKKVVGLLSLPDRGSLEQFHSRIFGELPHRIIDLETEKVESILLKLNQDSDDSVIPVPGTKSSGHSFILVCELKPHRQKPEEQSLYRSFIRNFSGNATPITEGFQGQVVKHTFSLLCICFHSAAKAVQCAIVLQQEFNKNLFSSLERKVELIIRLDGVKFENYMNLSADESVKKIRRLSYIKGNRIMISPGFRDICEDEAPELLNNNGIIRLIGEDEEQLVNKVMDFMDSNWQNEALHVNDFCRSLNCSKSQVYRKIVATLGSSPNTFIKKYRLERSLELLHLKRTNIAEVAYESGFSSPSYYTKCFQNHYGLTPSDYLRQQVV